MNFNPEKNQESSISLEQLIKKLELGGKYKIIDQKVGQDVVELDGQKIILPFTNMSGMKVIMTKDEDNKWVYVVRGNKSELQSIITALPE